MNQSLYWTTYRKPYLLNAGPAPNRQNRFRKMIYRERPQTL